MYRVLISEHHNLSKDPEVTDLVMTTESLHKIIGRFTIKYGVPTELVADEGLKELEFYKKYDKGWVSVTVGFANVGEIEKKLTQESKPVRPIVEVPIVKREPEKVYEPQDERIQELIDKGVADKW